jgi:phosphoadenosine phosphosulfate reductase
VFWTSGGDYHSPEAQAKVHGDRLYERDADLCSEISKVIPLTRVLRGLDAWITAYRRDSSLTRTNAAIVDQYSPDPGG